MIEPAAPPKGRYGIREQADREFGHPEKRFTSEFAQMMSFDQVALQKVIVAEPRGFCAGVERAIETVRQALQVFGKPLYVRHQIVHNRFVVQALEGEGAVFVDDLAQVPEGCRVIFSAHGVAPSEWTYAKNRRLRVTDATCPLVTKVHLEVENYTRQGRTVVLIGHAGHEEVKGIFGVAPNRVVLVETVEDALSIPVPDPSRLAVVTQTTLSLDDTREILNALKRRFPLLTTDRSADICYATQNRQNAVKELALVSDAILVVGSRESSNSNRMVEVARAQGIPAYLIDSLADIKPRMLCGVGSLGLTSGASSPDVLIQEILAMFRDGGIEIEFLSLKKERVHFTLPVLE